VPLLVAMVRAISSRSLDDVPADVGATPPFVSAIIPARNERRNIEQCVRSLLGSRYPAFEVIVVDDHSADGTGDAARAIAHDDRRLRIVNAPDLPADWFGKQWACAAGASEARGELLLFTDADTRHAADLLPRAVNALEARNADLFTIAGHQEMHSFWERVIQPQMFALLSMRYGGTEHVTGAKRAEDVIANGQYILVRRAPYFALGGHERVRGRVAEDLALAQEFFRAGHRVVMMLALRQFSTHMYASLGEIVGGWRKNIFAGGRDAVLGGATGRVLYPFLLIAAPLAGLLPPVMLALSAAGVLSGAWLLWSAIVVGTSLMFWLAVYRVIGEALWYAALYPLGLALLAYIAIGSVLRGNRVTWKGRAYRAQ
jgi:chlorobactene glucosyltransferase